MGDMDSAEFTEWGAYEVVNGPIDGRSHDDRLTEYLALVIASNNGFSKRRPKPRDYRIEWDRGRKRLTPEEVEQKIYKTFGPPPRRD